MTALYIDWRHERKIVMPFIKGNGAILHVEYYGIESAWNKFGEVLSDMHASSSGRSLSIRLDPSWFNTHTIDDIIDEFEEQLCIKKDTANQFHLSASLLSNNEIGGDATFNLSNVNFHNENIDNQSRQTRISDIVSALEKYLEDGRCMILVHHHKPEQFNQFWRKLWANGLENLVKNGLFLVIFRDIDQQNNLHMNAPSATSLIRLPRDFADDVRGADAYDDLYDIFTNKGLNCDRASEASSTIMALSQRSVSVVYDNVATKLLSMAMNS